MKLFKNIRIPAVIQNVLIVAVLLLIGVGLIAAVGAKMNSDTQRVLVKINKSEQPFSMITKEDVYKYIKKNIPSMLRNSPVKDLQLRKLEKKLEEHPQIHKVDIFLDNNNIIEIKVYQKEPIFRVFEKDKESYYLGRRGEIIPLSQHFTPRVPVVIIESGKLKKEIVYKELLEVYNVIKGNDFMGNLIDQVLVDDEGISIVPLVGDFIIKVGTTSKLDTKFKKLETLYKKALIHKGWDKYKIIDLRFEGQVVAQKR